MARTMRSSSSSATLGAPVDHEEVAHVHQRVGTDPEHVPTGADVVDRGADLHQRITERIDTVPVRVRGVILRRDERRRERPVLARRSADAQQLAERGRHQAEDGLASSCRAAGAGRGRKLVVDGAHPQQAGVHAAGAGPGGRQLGRECGGHQHLSRLGVLLALQRARGRGAPDERGELTVADEGDVEAAAVHPGGHAESHGTRLRRDATVAAEELVHLGRGRRGAHGVVRRREEARGARHH